MAQGYWQFYRGAQRTLGRSPAQATKGSESLQLRHPPEELQSHLPTSWVALEELEVSYHTQGFQKPLVKE